MKRWLAGLALLIAAAAQAADEPPRDLGLEDGASAATRAWVAERNAETEAQLLADPRHAAEVARFAAIARLGHGDEYLNGGLVHRRVADATHPLGRWEVRAVTPAARRWVGRDGWRTMLDLDALAAREGRRWSFSPGWLNPMCDTRIGPRCVLLLTPDGGDRVVLREFDLQRADFVAGGFRIDTPARTYAHWVDADHLLLASDFGPGTLSSAGYARQSRLWRRGTPLAEAALRFEAPADAVLYIPHAYRSSHGPVFVAEVWRQAGGAPEWWQLHPGGAAATRLALPVDLVRYHGVIGIAADRLLLMTAQPLGDWPAGSLLAAPLPGARGTIEPIFVPATDEAVDPIFHLAVADDGLWFGVMKNVSGELWSARRGPAGWQRQRHAVPPHGAIKLLSGEVSPSSVLVRTESLLAPPTVEVRAHRAPPTVIARTAPAFDATPYVTEPHSATSRDGTRVPYYIVRPRTHRFDGSAAALLTAYGGFGISFLPAYLSSEFQSDFAWTLLAAGGIHVHVNIRGGGEFGPAWHRAAKGREHPRGLEDLAAVAEDLVRIGAASAKRLGFAGASNGGLLATAIAVQRPGLFSAVVADVPITDMLRFHELFTGAVWIDEYGDPRDPGDRAVLRSYSPLHNLKPLVRYPRLLLTTSSSDDRVHPGHARRFAQALRRLGQPVLFHESADAGHEGAGALDDAARRRALKAVFLLQGLFPQPPAALPPELDPPEFRITEAEREHLALLRRPNAHFLSLLERRETVDGRTMHPKTQWFLETIARPADTPESLDAEERLVDTPEGRAEIRRFVDRAWTLKTRLGAPLESVQDLRIPARGGELPVRVYTPRRRAGDGAPRPLIVYCHGGGWLFGSVAAVDRAMRILADEAGAVVVSVDYRLAPEHPYPAAHDDAEDAFAWALAHAAEWGADPRRVGIGGDSAGGHLAVAVSRRRVAAGLAPPALQLLYYPFVDWQRDTASFRAFGAGYGLDARFIDVMERLMFPDPASRRGPEFSHLAAPSLKGLPPTVVVTAGFDILRDQGRAFAARLQADGVPVTWLEVGSLGHGFMQRSGVYDDADRACVDSARLAGWMLRSGPPVDTTR